MKVFGKKCPACGGKTLLVRPATSRLAALPLVRAFACADCHQQLLYLFPFSISREYRTSCRKRMPSHFLVRINGNTGQYARIQNLSEGGLCFQQQYRAAPFASPRLSLALYNCHDGSSLEQIAAEIVATNEHLIDIAGHRTTAINYSTRFIHLSQAQRKVLAGCLTQHGFD